MSGGKCGPPPPLPGHIQVSLSRWQGMQVRPPVRRHPALRTRRRLTLRATEGRCQLPAEDVAALRVIPEPPLPGLKRPDDRMTHLLGVLTGVTRRRRLAAADVPAGGAPAQVQPPATLRFALHADGPAGRHRHVDRTAGLRIRRPDIHGNSVRRPAPRSEAVGRLAVLVAVNDGAKVPRSRLSWAAKRLLHSREDAAEWPPLGRPFIGGL